MNRNKELAKNTLIIFIGTIFTKLITFFLLPLYTSILSTEEYGIVDLFNTLISLIIPLISLKIEDGTFRYLIKYRDDSKKQKEVLTTSLFFNLAITIICLIIFLAINKLINIKYKTYFVIAVIVTNISTYLLQCARGLGSNTKYSVAGVVMSLFTIFFNILFLVILKFNFIGMFLGTILGNVFCIIYLVFSLKIYKYLAPKSFNKKILKDLLKYSIPLIASSLSWWVFSSSDRLIVSNALGLSANGILSISYKFSTIYIIIYNIFNTSWTESVAIHINDKDIDNYFNSIFSMAFKFFLALGLCIIMSMPIVFKIMINSKFYQAYYLVPFMMIASICQAVVGMVSASYIAKNDTKPIAYTAILSAIINVVIHLLLINSVGLYAAAISTLASYLFFSIFRIVDVKRKYINIKVKFNFILTMLIMVSIMMLCYYNNSIYIKIVGMIFAIIYSLIINKNSFDKIKNYASKKIRKYR